MEPMIERPGILPISTLPSCHNRSDLLGDREMSLKPKLPSAVFAGQAAVPNLPADQLSQRHSTGVPQ
jgi:hypothetical protein